MIKKSKITKSSKGNIRQRLGAATAVELAITTGIMIVAAAATIPIIQDQRERIKNLRASQMMHEVQEGAERYLRANYSALLAVADAGSPVEVPITGGPINGLTSLQADSNLRPTFAGRDPFNNQYMMLVREPNAGQLEAIITTFGDTIVQDDDVAEIAAYIGATGGFFPTTAPVGRDNTIIGVDGSWEAPLADWQTDPAGPPVSTVAAGTYQSVIVMDAEVLTGGFISRFDIGVPEANRMETDLDMNGNRLLNVADIELQSGALLSESIFFSTIASSGDVIGKPVCAVGQTPQIFGAPVKASDNGVGKPMIAFRAIATDLGASWQVRLEVDTEDATGTGNVTVVTTPDFGQMWVATKCTTI